MSQLLGTSGFVTVSATNYNVTEWSITVNNDTQDVTDVSTNWQQLIAGINSADVSFKIFWGASAGTFTTVFAIGTAVSLTLAIGASTKTFVVPVVISSYTVTNNAKSPVEFTVQAKSTGSPTMPV